MTQPARVSPRVTAALGLRPGDSMEAHLAAAGEIRAKSDLAKAHAAEQEREPRRLEALAEWLQDESGLATVLTSTKSAITDALTLPRDATESQIVERIAELYSVTAPADPVDVLAQRELARVMFRQRTEAQLKADPKLDLATAQARASREHPELFAAAMGR